MDLGIDGRRAIVCASSRGLGKACALALAREGCEVFINGRDEARLGQAAREIEQATGHRPTPIVADLDSDAGRAALLAACPQPDILVNNNAGPAPGELAQWDHAAWLAALEANLLAPILLMSAVVPGMRARKFGRVVNITSAVVKSPRLGMSLSTTARTGLTAFAKGLSREAVADNVTINNLLPQHIDTDRQQYMARRIMEDRGITFEQARALQLKSVRARRLGRPEEFGDACAFLCSAQASFISGQNLQLDGGSYDGLF
ncbi:SDR family oxidoreductase [Burkholderia multivorans]|uniref:SDR family oxidoreductase n=1 Tax=Burkholderia multivorans TaxID=87883 RepID=UPI000D0087F0|nr:SDR family oxidoreductase [Burkholderia multivorans]MBU9312874.1 SDR family oxidoreductase [Burkholderia multivorans]MCA8251088.1 SDR family oxidoreductase [Burkholderia multivorans]MCA8457789.1 SDR family oxidoreductase [Burkholderia multivorans]MDN7871956.1 SDR family oxidoreductase [Burkholderia multivorans]PRE10882.1 3-oxoacyl-ACP reductase [Burkholderia multivorans]